MKKMFENKLTLNKETVSNLEMNAVHGGATFKIPNCCSLQCTGNCPTTSENPRECISTI